MAYNRAHATIESNQIIPMEFIPFISRRLIAFSIILIILIIIIYFYLFSGSYSENKFVSRDTEQPHQSPTEKTKEEKRDSISELTILNENASTSLIYPTFTKSDSHVYCSQNYDASCPQCSKNHVLSGVDAKSVEIISSNILKDKNYVYLVKFCTDNSMPELTKFSPGDVSSFNSSIKVDGSEIFIDSYAVYARLPQEYFIEKLDRG